MWFSEMLGTMCGDSLGAVLSCSSSVSIDLLELVGEVSSLGSSIFG